MTLADTSVWIAHFREGSPGLAGLLNEGSVLVHPFVIGELACGNFRDRTSILNDLQALPVAVTASHEEVLHVIERRKLWLVGIGWIDAHLLAAALLSNCQLWTLDLRLLRAATRAGVELCRISCDE
jgi:predicted nucleic acid-binding protein